MKKPNMPKQRDIAAALGISEVAVSVAKRKGMPVHTIAGAVEWHARRKGRPRQAAAELPQVESIPPEIAAGMIGELEGRIRKAKRLTDAAQDRAQAEIESGDGEAAKKSGDLASSSQKTLLMLERELRQRRVDSGELVPMTAAIERFGKILAELLAAIDTAENEFCIEANPDNPGRASKAFRKFRDTVRRKAAGV